MRWNRGDFLSAAGGLLTGTGAVAVTAALAWPVVQETPIAREPLPQHSVLAPVGPPAPVRTVTAPSLGDVTLVSHVIVPSTVVKRSVVVFTRVVTVRVTVTPAPSPTPPVQPSPVPQPACAGGSPLTAEVWLRGAGVQVNGNLP